MDYSSDSNSNQRLNQELSTHKSEPEDARFPDELAVSFKGTNQSNSQQFVPPSPGFNFRSSFKSKQGGSHSWEESSGSIGQSNKRSTLSGYEKQGDEGLNNNGNKVNSNLLPGSATATTGKLKFEVLFDDEDQDQVPGNSSSGIIPSQNGERKTLSGLFRPVKAALNDSYNKVKAEKFFANNPDRLARAKVYIQKNCLDRDLDGDLVEFYAISEIDNWSHEQERVACLNQRSLCVINYNFITEKLTRENAEQCVKRVLYSDIREVIAGPLNYPENSLLASRNNDCVKIVLEQSPVKFADKWTPFSTKLPWVLLSSHPLAGKVSGNRGVYQIEILHDSLCKIIRRHFMSLIKPSPANAVSEAPAQVNKNISEFPEDEAANPQSQRIVGLSQTGQPSVELLHDQRATFNRTQTRITLMPKLTQGEIHMESYLGLTSLIFNQSKMAFALDRNGICF